MVPPFQSPEMVITIAVADFICRQLQEDTGADNILALSSSRQQINYYGLEFNPQAIEQFLDHLTISAGVHGQSFMFPLHHACLDSE